MNMHLFVIRVLSSFDEHVYVSLYAMLWMIIFVCCLGWDNMRCLDRCMLGLVMIWDGMIDVC